MWSVIWILVYNLQVWQPYWAWLPVSMCHLKSWVTLRVKEEIHQHSNVGRDKWRAQWSPSPFLRYWCFKFELRKRKWDKGQEVYIIETALVEVWTWSLSSCSARLIIEFLFFEARSPLLEETRWFSKMSSVSGCSCTFIDNCPHMREGLS